MCCKINGIPSNSCCLSVSYQTERDSLKLQCETLQAEYQKNNETQVWTFIHTYYIWWNHILLPCLLHRGGERWFVWIWPRGSQQNLNLVLIHFWSSNLYMYWFGAAQTLITSFNILDLELCTHLSCRLRLWLSLKQAIIKTYNYSLYTRSFCSILYSSPLLVLSGYKPLQRW